jgi:hypothetical protein
MTTTKSNWAIEAANFCGDGCAVKSENVKRETAVLIWPNGETEIVKRDNSSIGWRFLNHGYDPAYAAGYAYACGYKD